MPLSYTNCKALVERRNVSIAALSTSIGRSLKPAELDLIDLLVEAAFIKGQLQALHDVLQDAAPVVIAETISLDGPLPRFDS